MDRITSKEIYVHREKRLGGGASARTVNLDGVALGNVLMFAEERGHIEALPAVKQFKRKPSPKKALLTKEFVSLLAAATANTAKGSELFCCYLRFLALIGARGKGVLVVRSADVDFRRETVIIRVMLAGGRTAQTCR